MIEIYDIETLINCFTYTGMNRNTKEVKQFVIHKDRNELQLFISHLKGLQKQIGFNNLNFDSQVIQYILNNNINWNNLNGEEVSKLIYDYSQITINKMNNGGFADYPEWKLTISQMDLFKIWHFDNKAKMTSLKWIEYMIDMENIEEMPIKHYEYIKLEQIQSILDYNLNDVIATHKLYEITKGNTDISLYKGVDKIQLRVDIGNQFGLKCINFNDVKIGDQINKSSYCTLSGKDKKSLPVPNKNIKLFKFKDCFPSYMKFQTLEFNNFINALSNVEVDLNKKQEFQFTYNGTTYLIAKGGLHSKDKPRLVKPLENEILRDADVGSMYPNAIRKRKLYPNHLGNEWLIGYTDIIQKRLDSKSLYKKTKETKYQAIQEAYKLALNGGGFGKTNEESSWQYDPFVTMCTTIGSQIDLLMLIESLEINGIHIISANTDGIVCLFDKSLDSIYYQVCKNWEKLVDNADLGQLEYIDYKLLAQTSVNDYIAIKLNGESKTKGDFVSEFELHKNKSARIIPLALQEYFINSVPIEQTIKNHQNIFDFCLGVKSIGNNKLISLDVKSQIEIPLQKINRYYISNNGINLIKRLPKLENKIANMQLDIFGNIDDGIREAEVEAGWLSTIYNKHIIKDINDYDINYNYYVDKCNKILKNII